MSEKKYSIPSFLERILTFFEHERFDIFSMFLWILTLSVIRMWSEAYLLDYPYKEISFRYLFFQAHITSFFIVAFIGGVLLLKFFSNQKLAKVANLAGLGFLMVLVPPFLDVFIFKSSTPYDYISPLQFFEALFTLGTSENINWGGAGVIFELMGITGATSLYVFIRRFQDGIVNAVKYTLANFVTFIVFFLIIGSPFLMLLRGGISPGAEIIQPLFVLRYLLISVVLILLLIRITKKGLLSSFIKSSRLMTTAHFGLMTFVGIIISAHLFQIGPIDFDFFALFSDPLYLRIFPGNMAMFLLSIITIMVVWQYAVMINHVYDVNIDKLDNKDRVLPLKMLTLAQVKKIALIYAIVSLGLGFLMGLWSLLLVAIGLFFGTIYSMPPIRIRDGVFSTAIIGIGSSIAFFLGFYTPSYVKVMYGEFAGEIMRVYPDLSTDSVIIGVLIFVALTIGPLIKDYKDYDGDKKAGVKNLFTIYGLEKGVKITTFLLPIPFLCLILLFHNIIDILLLVPAGIFAAVIFNKMRDTRLVFAIYFPIIIYCLLRWFSIIQW